VLAFLNIVGHGMRGGTFEQDVLDMDVPPAVEMARRHRGVIVGFKTAHFQGPAWTPVERAVEAGTRTGLPVMVDFGRDQPERPIEDLVLRKLRPGDVYTHLYSGLRRELVEGRVNDALLEARRRGVIFDVGHGAGSFRWRVAVPIVKAGFLPDSISTDLHTSSMNAGMKDMLNVMSKFLALGVPIKEVIARSTWNPARQIRQETLGHLSVGAPADVAVLRLERGRFGYLDVDGARLAGSERLTCEVTVRAGTVVYDLNGLGGIEWERLEPAR
jgi:dihydroorotase